jgi:hypothetical protein
MDASDIEVGASIGRRELRFGESEREGRAQKLRGEEVDGVERMVWSGS